MHGGGGLTRRTVDKNMPLAWPNSLSMVINHTQGKTKSLAEILSLLSLPLSLIPPLSLSGGTIVDSSQLEP